MISISITEIAEILGTEVVDSDKIINDFLIDSRNLLYPETTLFIALQTSSNDGHAYIPELYGKGVRYFIVSNTDNSNIDYEKEYPEGIFFQTGSPIDALQTIGKAIREKKKNIPVIGITGSKGKTIVKEMINSLLSTQFSIARSPRSYNSQIGVPLSACEINEHTQLSILEAGISKKGEMDKLQKIIQPTIGVFTSITEEHSEGFASLQEKAEEKALLFVDSQIVFYPKDNNIIEAALKKMAPMAMLHPVSCESGNYATMIALANEVASQLSHKRYSKAKLDALHGVITPKIDVRDTLKNCVVINDGYTVDYRALTDALNFAHRNLTSTRSLTLILEYSPDFAKNDLPRLLKARGVKRFFGINFPKDQQNKEKGWDEACKEVKFLDSTAEFQEKFCISDFCDEAILVKGTAANGYENITSMLETPRHETVLEVDLGAIVHNFNYYRSLLAPGTGLVAMVKAAGYGVGALELSKTLQSQGAAYLAVAVVDEGAELRRGGITMPIIVMNPMSTNYKALFDSKLEPSVFSIRELELLLNNARRLGVENYPVHIKLDTGMHRLGFLEEELEQLADKLNCQNYVRVASIFSHLATADCLDQDAYTESQLAAFKKMSEKLIEKIGYKPLRHILNTAGMMRYPEHHYDMARLGIGLYGVSPIAEVKGDLETVAKLKTTIISIKHWNTGTSIGYARKGKVMQPSIIATIPIGYADGLDRHLSNGAAWVLVNGVKCPIIGNICMDQCMIDVTNAKAQIGDTVEIFGDNAPLTRLSDTLNTIPYEILTSISPRVKRIYQSFK